MTKPVPSKKQLEFMDWEFGVFFHFGIRSFYKHHRDWDGLPMPREIFNPEELHCEKWLLPAKQAGARYAILVCKHHDGFANWPTRCSDYSVAHTPWRGGKGDVVREFTDCCRRLGLKVGLYYSPAQWGNAQPFAEGHEYDDYFIAQISELLSDYGKIDYLWFDGCGSENHEYDQARIIRAIRSLQPDILIFNMWDPDTRWVGNEDGMAPSPNFNVTGDVDFSVLTTEKESLGQMRFLPAECDCMMRDTWFDCEDNEDKVKTPDELLGLYEMSVGRGANLLLNIGPDRRGLLPEKDLASLEEFGRRLSDIYGHPAGDFTSPEKIGQGQWHISAKSAALVNRAVLQEELSMGESCHAFKLFGEIQSGKTLLLFEGTTIGHKRICTFPLVALCGMTLQVTAENGETILRSMQVYRA